MEQRPIAELKNLGPTTARDLAEVGVATYAELQEVGPVDAWHRLNELRPKFYDPDRPPAASKAVVPGVGAEGRSIVIDMIAVKAP